MVASLGCKHWLRCIAILFLCYLLPHNCMRVSSGEGIWKDIQTKSRSMCMPSEVFFIISVPLLVASVSADARIYIFQARLDTGTCLFLRLPYLFSILKKGMPRWSQASWNFPCSSGRQWILRKRKWRNRGSAKRHRKLCDGAAAKTL